MRDLDLKAAYAMDSPEEIKHAPCLLTIDLVLKELHNRQIKGFLPKRLDAMGKNRIAMKMVDLIDRV